MYRCLNGLTALLVLSGRKKFVGEVLLFGVGIGTCKIRLRKELLPLDVYTFGLGLGSFYLVKSTCLLSLCHT